MSRFVDIEPYDDCKIVLNSEDQGVPCRDIPTADVEEVQYGEWIDDADDVYWGNYIVKKHCSRCDLVPHFDREKELFDLSERCPRCGAHMYGR